MKKIILILFTIALMSCGSESKNTILEKYTQTMGNPTGVVEEKQGKMSFFTYTWDGPKGHSELVVSKFDGKWEEVRFNSY